jgi:hypothetical protein
MLTSLFGGWPSFHDAEVLRVRLDRGTALDVGYDQGRKPSLEADIHVYEITGEVTDQGVYALRNHTLVTLAFHGIDRVELADFSYQNTLFGLRLEDITDRQLETLRWQVGFDASAGLGASFLCEDIEVVEAAPIEPPAHLSAR